MLQAEGFEDTDVSYNQGRNFTGCRSGQVIAALLSGWAESQSTTVVFVAIIESWRYATDDILSLTYHDTWVPIEFVL